MTKSIAFIYCDNERIDFASNKFAITKKFLCKHIDFDYYLAIAKCAICFPDSKIGAAEWRTLILCEILLPRPCKISGRRFVW